MKTTEQQLNETQKDLREAQQAIIKLQHAIRLVERRAKNAEHQTAANALEITNIKRLLRGQGS